MSEAQKGTCKSCAFSRERDSDSPDDDSLLECRRDTPSMPLEMESINPFRGVWPDVLPTEDCGEYRPANEVQRGRRGDA